MSPPAPFPGPYSLEYLEARRATKQKLLSIIKLRASAQRKKKQPTKPASPLEDEKLMLVTNNQLVNEALIDRSFFPSGFAIESMTWLDLTTWAKDNDLTHALYYYVLACQTIQCSVLLRLHLLQTGSSPSNPAHHQAMVAQSHHIAKVEARRHRARMAEREFYPFTPTPAQEIKRRALANQMLEFVASFEVNEVQGSWDHAFAMLDSQAKSCSAKEDRRRYKLAARMLRS